MYFNKDKVIKDLTKLVDQKNAKIKKLTKTRFDNHGNGKYLIINFNELDPKVSDQEDPIDRGGITFWYRRYNMGPLSAGGFAGYAITPPEMIRSGSETPGPMAPDDAISCVKDCEFTYSQLMKFYSYCLHRTYYPKVRYYQARVGTVPALPALKKFHLKE